MHIGGLQLVKEDLVEVGNGTNETGLQRSPLVEGLEGAGDANVFVDPDVKMSSDNTKSMPHSAITYSSPASSLGSSDWLSSH